MKMILTLLLLIILQSICSLNINTILLKNRYISKTTTSTTSFLLSPSIIKNDNYKNQIKKNNKNVIKSSSMVLKMSNVDSITDTITNSTAPMVLESVSTSNNVITVDEIKQNTISINTNNDNNTNNSIMSGLLSFLKGNWLVVGELIVIFLAQKNPRFFASGGKLHPEFWISRVGVFIIFFINGIALSISGNSDDLKSATKTNITIQAFNFMFIPLFAKIFSQFYPDPAFRDGLVVLSCLPTTINICVAQTLAAGGNMGTAIFNAIFANVIGVFLTPLLAVWLLGAGKGVSLLATLGKLGNVVVTPLVIGQICRYTPIGAFAQRVQKYSRTLSSCLLLAIVYNVFSDTFVSGLGVGGMALVRLCITMPLTYLSLSAIFWQLSKKLLPGLDPQTRAAALFCATQKTLAFGIPFIKTALSHRPDIAYILAPLLMYAPSQLLFGSSIIVPAMKKLISQRDIYQEGAGI